MFLLREEFGYRVRDIARSSRDVGERLRDVVLFSVWFVLGRRLV